MENRNFKFDKITLLITHYNRSNSLGNLLMEFRNLNCLFKDIVVSDDGSKPEQLEKVKLLQKEFKFILITTPVNKGLGNNINKGQDAVQTPFTLYVQEDFIPKPEFPSRLKEALDVMEQKSEFDIARFYAYFKYPYLRPYNDHFSEMYFSNFGLKYRKLHFYSDHPHLRRSTFFSKFGRYPEGLRVDKTEYNMSISFIRNKGKGIFFNQYKSLFSQVNSAEEPSTVARRNIKFFKKPSLRFVRDLYRQIKFNYDIHFYKLKVKKQEV